MRQKQIINLNYVIGVAEEIYCRQQVIRQILKLFNHTAIKSLAGFVK